MKLTKAQERAKSKLDINNWQCAYDLGESTPTLEGLVSRGVAEQKRDALGIMYSPRTAIWYRLRSNVKLTGGL